MISYLHGTALRKTPRFLVLEVHGVGYKVFTTASTLDTIREGAECTFWTHLAVREDAHDIYGFTDEETLGFFELLITISGIGPRSALNILNIVSPKTLRQAVSSGDTSYLTKVSGIGKKIAEKIVIELKGKFEAEEGEQAGEHLRGDSDALEALRSLGYSEREVREVLKKIPEDEDGKVLNAGDKVKKALKLLGQATK